ncbi:MAG TPA: YeeE/YedE thiosulfate transporter family protein [Steroidobacteraceae bacterium]|nr:YeeE/YedE thiosulfate transporter family protein [Steroidobacteraceae bacterium]
MLPTAWIDALLGGLLIGAAAVVLLYCNGRIAGISGITADVVSGDTGEGAWRLAFLAGLIAPAFVFGAPDVAFAGNLPWLAASGLLVGIGTRVGSGCTSGHGVCGLSNLSLRSLVATATFMAVAIATVYLVRHA